MSKNGALDEIRTDLRAEQRALGEVLAKLGPDDWERATHAPGWAVRDQVMHLTALDEAATQAIREPGEFLARFAPGIAEAGAHEREYIAEGRALSHDALLARWQDSTAALLEAASTLSPETRIPWFGPDMGAISFLTARLMETWSHGLDVVDVTPPDRPDTDRLRHICFLGVRTRAWSYEARGLPVPDTPAYIDLELPSGAVWTVGDRGSPDAVRGTATDFCRVVTQRRHVDDTSLEVTGPFAREWMELAQAFAGPPGEGRQPGQFAPGR